VRVIFVALPLALLLAAGFVAVFFWAVRSGQFDDLDTPAVRILQDAVSVQDPVSGPARSAGSAPPPSTDTPATPAPDRAG
jgi:cbb3-type cytochrome oxidase maturation protein